MKNNHSFLLEIGLEEMPAKMIEGAMAQLQEKTEKWLDEQRLLYSKVCTYATPRRLALYIEGLASKQEDISEEAKGPAKKIAQDDAGHWSKAAIGFARGQGLTPEEIYFKELKGVEYAYLSKEIKGQDTVQVLSQMKDIISQLSFPKNMRWGSEELKYIRPIRWLVALLDEQVIPLELAGLKASNLTLGHRFLGKETQINDASSYVKVLEEQYVLAEVQKRQEMIMQQIGAIEEEQGWVIPIEQDLLEEVTHLVEYPTAIFGSFDEQFLAIPEEVLVTSMREHQRYFPVRSGEGKLLPYFVTIRNGLEDKQNIVAKGNEKVLRARLSDASFFYKEDQKLTIEKALEQLESVVFHEELGTTGDKIRRVQDISRAMADKLECSKEVQQTLSRAAEISKFDLVTQMVYEFPELQGKMGQEYALLAGEEKDVASAIFEHYLPRFAGDILPASSAGAILSVADKLDSIIGFFSIGVIPTGSQDPYALRRQAMGIVQILLKEKWSMTLADLFEVGIDVFEQRNLLKRSRAELLQDVEAFFQLRFKTSLQDLGIRYDVVDALLHQMDEQLFVIAEKGKVLMNHLDQPSFKAVVEAFTRVNNITQKNESASISVEEQLFENESEQQLYKAYQEVASSLMRNRQNVEQVYQQLITLQGPIEDYFNEVMVMAEDEAIRKNRLAQLQLLSTLIFAFADFSKIVLSGKN